MSTSITADFVIIGSGIAGLRAAVALAPHGRVIVLTKAEPRAGSTGYAQGGIAAAVGPDDSPALHAADTARAGDGLCVAAAVDLLVTDGPAYVRELMAWGAQFDRRQDGALDLAREGAHSVRRVLHARDATGREIGRALEAHLRAAATVTVLDHALAVGLIVTSGVVAGARFVDATGAVGEVRARATLLATGGAGQVFSETTNPTVATGDGVALAYLAGAVVADLEFVQFHPTALAVPGAPRYLLSEALRGEGARLVNSDGEPFMTRYDPDGDLAPRDRVARAMVRESARTGAPVYLSLQHLPAAETRARFPLIAELCRSVGLDLATEPIPVGPAAHYLMGGVATDADGRTSLPGLFAAGEVACSGVHGANRLASNSLLEGLVFGGRAGLAMAAGEGRNWPSAPLFGDVQPAPDRGADDRAMSPLDEPTLRSLMWAHAGVFRDRAGLESALVRLDAEWHRRVGMLARTPPTTPETWRLVSLLTVSRLIARAAWRREESRGGHHRTDYPETDDLHWKRHVSDRFVP